MMKVSFIIPINNCESYIEECVQNLIRVDRSDFEIVLINDGSKDHSGAIIDKLAKNYPQVIPIHQSNQGVSAARNHGLKVASGEYVIFLDADDAINTSKIAQLLKIIEADDSIDILIYGLSFDYYFHRKCYLRNILLPSISGLASRRTWMKSIEQLYNDNALSPIWNKVIRKRILVENHLRLAEDMFLYEDLDFSLRCLAHCEKIYFFPECVYYYRQSEDEGNAGRRLRRIAHIPELIEKIAAALSELVLNEDNIDGDAVCKSILLKLYLVLAREKCEVSTIREIRIICRDFADWVDKERIAISRDDLRYAAILYDQKVMKIIVRRGCTRIRHKVAVRFKNTTWYQKKRGVHIEKPT